MCQGAGEWSESAWNDVDEAIAADIELFQITDAVERSAVQDAESIVRQIERPQFAGTRKRTCTHVYKLSQYLCLVLGTRGIISKVNGF